MLLIEQIIHTQYKELGKPRNAQKKKEGIKGALKRYSEQVSSADKGAIINQK